MRNDLGLNNYYVKVAGLIICLLSILTYLICRLLKTDISIYDNLDLPTLMTILFCCGMVLFLFSKEKVPTEIQLQNKNLISRLTLMAFYACLIAYSLIQAINDDFSVNILVPVIFFLVIQSVISLIAQYRELTTKGLYVFTTIVLIAGGIVLLLV